MKRARRRTTAARKGAVRKEPLGAGLVRLAIRAGVESVASIMSPVQRPKTNSRAILASQSASVELPA